ncbi:MAG: branched-chain amino acid transport system II carrier protein [Clostridia bacterium]|nr:branched-chain amino acid transport system II carrier protein [Clostridia bacterium]
MNKRLNSKQIILVAGTLFGMFFGAGNLIFPVHLGQLAGSNAIPAMIGFVITAVGIPILGVAAIGKTYSSGLQELSTRVGDKFAYIFTTVLYLTIGPLFAIPRCATTSFTIGVDPIVGGYISPKLALFIFSLIFFAFVLVLSLKPANITVWIGKVINPLFLVLLGIFIVVALIKNGSFSGVAPEASYESGALFSGFIEGYGTMDAIAGLAFGIVVIDIIRGMGVDDNNEIAKDVLKSGVIAGILMAVIYAATIIIGAQSKAIFPLSENGGIALSQLSTYYFGFVGNIILALTIILACLKTAIGLVTSCSDTFTRMFNGKISYSAFAVIFTFFSFAISNVGLSKIIELSIPVLMFLYPLSIVLILLALFEDTFGRARSVYVSGMIFTGIAALLDCFKALPASIQTALGLENIVLFAEKTVPFYGLGLGWIVPAVVGIVIGLVIRKVKD